MGIFNEHSSNHQPFAQGIQGAPGVGFNLTSTGDYDMVNKKLRNVGNPVSNTDAANKKYVDDNCGGGKTSSLTIDSNINMKSQFSITKLKHQQTMMTLRLRSMWTTPKLMAVSF